MYLAATSKIYDLRFTIYAPAVGSVLQSQIGNRKS